MRTVGTRSGALALTLDQNRRIRYSAPDRMYARFQTRGVMMSIVFDEGDAADFSDSTLSRVGGEGRPWSAVVHQAGRAIEEIEGVVSARVQLGLGDEVEEVHVVARGGRRAKEIVRDVETLLKAKFNFEIDHRKISVARLGESTQPAPEPEPLPRVHFRTVSLHLSRDGGEAQVELTTGGQRWVGRASSRGPDAAWPRLVAEATLDAVSQLLPPDSFLELADLVTTRIAERDVVLLNVRFRRDRHTQEMVGCAAVEGDMQRSVVFATLHSLNRFVGRFSESSQEEIVLEPPLNF